MPRPIFSLAEQVAAWRPDRRKLLIAQRWTGFSHRRHAFVLSMNDGVTGARADFPTNVDRSFADVKEMLRPYLVTEEQARDRLVELGLPREHHCTECEHRLPLGRLYCTNCGLRWGGHPTGGTVVTNPVGALQLITE